MSTVWRLGCKHTNMSVHLFCFGQPGMKPVSETVQKGYYCHIYTQHVSQIFLQRSSNHGVCLLSSPHCGDRHSPSCSWDSLHWVKCSEILSATANTNPAHPMPWLDPCTGFMVPDFKLMGTKDCSYYLIWVITYSLVCLVGLYKCQCQMEQTQSHIPALKMLSAQKTYSH